MAELLYEGKSKKVFKTNVEDELLVYYKDDATAFNAQKRGTVEDKGILNNKISEILFNYLSNNGVESHFIRRLSEREQIVKKVRIIPLEFIVRNYIAGSMANRLGLNEGDKCPVTVLDLCYKNDPLGDPLINDHHAVILNAARYDQLEYIYSEARKINSLLQKLFDEVGIILVDFKLEFGFNSNNDIILADEISPDTCRLWDKETLMKLDKDRFRRDLGSVTEAYQNIYNRLIKNINL